MTSTVPVPAFSEPPGPEPSPGDMPTPSIAIAIVGSLQNTPSTSPPTTTTTNEVKCEGYPNLKEDPEGEAAPRATVTPTRSAKIEPKIEGNVKVENVSPSGFMEGQQVLVLGTDDPNGNRETATIVKVGEENLQIKWTIRGDKKWVSANR